MRNRRKQLALVIGGLSVLYLGCAGLLFYSLPEPRRHFEYMVVGAGSTGVTMLVFYAGCLLRARL
jgi:hypothetical protein